jgi:hypothetical protein
MVKQQANYPTPDYPMEMIAPISQNFVKQPANYFADMKTVDLFDAIDQMAVLLDKPMPGKESHCLERIDRNNCIVDNDGSILAMSIVKPKIKTHEATAYENYGPEEWRDKHAKKKLRCMKYVPFHKKCALIFENG